jgi:hypothetical protein
MESQAGLERISAVKAGVPEQIGAEAANKDEYAAPLSLMH